jgi:hypothetical protein
MKKLGNISPINMKRDTGLRIPDEKKSKKCRVRAIRNLLIYLVLLLSAFILGYIIEPSVLKIIWLILTGTMTVLCGISMYIVILHNPVEDFCE